MSSNTSKSKAATLAFLQALISGLQKHFPGGAFMVSNVTYTTASLAARLQTLADAIAELLAAHAQVRDRVLRLKRIMADVGPAAQACERIVQASFGSNVEALADFGLAPRKPRTPRTSEKKLVAAARARATRRARGTKSRKQRLAIKGDVTGVIVTPVTAPAATPEPVDPTTPSGSTGIA